MPPITKTFLLIIQQEGISKDETRIPTKRTALVQLGESTENITIYRTVVDNGTKIDYVSVTTENVAQLINQSTQTGTVNITIDYNEDDPANEYAFEASLDTLAMLAENGLGLTLNSPEGDITISADTVAQASVNGMALYFRIVPVEDEAEEAEETFLGDGAVFSISTMTGQVFGTPKTIQTNMESYATTITLPLDGLSEEQLSDEEFLKTLCVYVEHDDGTTELVYGTLVYTDDIPVGIQFEISKFSRFQVVSMAQEATNLWIWVICIAGGILLILVILLLVVIQRRRRYS